MSATSLVLQGQTLQEALRPLWGWGWEMESPAIWVLKASLKIITLLGPRVDMAGTGDVSARNWKAREALAPL